MLPACVPRPASSSRQYSREESGMATITAFLPGRLCHREPQGHGYVLRERKPRRSLSENSQIGFDETSLDLAEAPCGSRRYVRPR